MVNAQQIVELHRKHSSGTLAVPSEFTLAAAIEHLLWLRSIPSQHSGDELWRALLSTGWPAADAQDVVNGTLGVRVLPPRYDLVWLRHTEADLRTKIAASGLTPVTAKALTGAVSEIINNIWQHAQSATPALLAYRLESERVHIGVADNGIGVLNSLRTNARYASLKTSMAALKKAMAVGVTRFEEEGHGYGFDTLLRAVADQWGAVRLRTGQAILEFHSTTDLRCAITSYGVDLPGLQIALCCGTKPPATPITL